MFLPLRYGRETTPATYRDENETQESKPPRNGGRETKTCGLEDHPQRRHDQAKQESISTRYSGVAKDLEDLENTRNGGLGIETIKSSKAPETVGQSMKNLPMQENFERRFQKVLQNNKGFNQDGNPQAFKR